MFRRRESAVPDAPGQDTAGGAGLNGAGKATGNGRAVTAGKGKPTPKRSEAERRRHPYSAPGNSKEANRQYRARERAERARKSDAMRRGEEWALPPRDRGPVKALARDYVDSKRRISEYYMYGLVVAIFLMLVPSPAMENIVLILVMVAIFVMLVEGFLIGRRVLLLVRERLPGQSTRGIRMYAGMRALQARPLRMPKPRIKPGEAY